MSVSNWFQEFCSRLRMDDSVVSSVRARYRQITKRINQDYWTSDSEIDHSLYVGSYGRGTAIHVSDIDVIVQLPFDVYQRFNGYIGNGQSALIQEVRNVLQRTYRTSYLRGDGQVIKIDFSNGISYEIVPGFINKDKISYTFPDTNNGGRWRVTDPRSEIEEINNKNNQWNSNLKRLCRMARAWKDKWDVPIGGLLIDTLAYKFLSNWNNKDKSYLYYDFMSRDFFKYLKDLNSDTNFWLAPGSNQRVYRNGYFEYKALRCYNISLEAINSGESYPYTAKSKWRDIYGTKFPI